MAVTNKSWYKSKTLWINFIAVVALGFQTAYGFVVPADYLAYALGIINIIMRIITKTGLVE